MINMSAFSIGNVRTPSVRAYTDDGGDSLVAAFWKLAGPEPTVTPAPVVGWANSISQTGGIDFDGREVHREGLSAPESYRPDTFVRIGKS
jgi:hypothetical protein